MFSTATEREVSSSTTHLTIDTLYEVIAKMPVSMSFSGCGQMWAPDWINGYGELLFDKCGEEVKRFTMENLIVRWTLSNLYHKCQHTKSGHILSSAVMSHTQRKRSDIPLSFGRETLVYTANSNILRLVNMLNKNMKCPGELEYAPIVVGSITGMLKGYINPQELKSGMFLTPYGAYVDVDEIVQGMMKLLDEYTAEQHKIRLPFGVVVHHKAFLLHMIMVSDSRKEPREYKCTILDGARNSHMVKKALGTSIKREIHIMGTGARIDSLHGMGYRGALLQYLKGHPE
jgi:hypothetical protein